MKHSTLVRKTLGPMIIGLSSLLSLMESPLHAECMWKVEAGPAYAHLDVLESKRTVQKLDMLGVRGEASLIFGQGWCIKPNILYGKTSDGDAELVTANLGFGRCIPISERVIVSPQVGVSYTSLNTTFHMNYPPFGSLKFRETVRSPALYAGAEVIFKICKDWRFCVSGQYSWSRAKTKIKDLLHSKSDAEGPTYSAMLEYDVTCDWSVNVAAAFNQSLSREKNGLRGRGGKIGIARWF